MNKSDLVKKLKEAGFVGDFAEEAFKTIFGSIAGELRAGGKVVLKGFGTFEVKETKARDGRNPKTGAAIQIPAGRKVTFKASKSLLD